MLVTVSHFHPSLIFEGKSPNLARKLFARVNVGELTHHAVELITSVKRLKCLLPQAFVTYKHIQLDLIDRIKVMGLASSWQALGLTNNN